MPGRVGVVCILQAGVVLWCGASSFADWDDGGGPSRDRYALDIYWENDGGYLQANDPRDRYYTNGVALTVSHRPRWAEALAERMPFGEERGRERTAAGYAAGHLMFTPEDIEERELIEDDRPYAGYAFVGAYWQRATQTRLDHIQMDVGLVGPSTHGKGIQTWVHDTFGGRDPRGWGNQLRDEPTFQVHVNRRWRFDAAPIEVGQDYQIEAQVLPTLGASAGTVYRHVEGEVTLRLGRHLPDDFGPGRIHRFASATGDPERGWGAYSFGRVGARVVEHNLFLAGNTWQDSHSVSARPFVAEFEGGLAVAYRGDEWAFKLHYSQIYQSKVFDQQEGLHSFGALHVHFSRTF